MRISHFEELFRITRSIGCPFSSKYRLGQISEGCTPRLLAIIHSPLGQGRDRALANVDELSPSLRDTAAKVVPSLRKAAIMSAVCQSFLFIFFISPYNKRNELSCFGILIKVKEMASIYSYEYQLVIKALRKARIEKGITQKSLAQALDRPQSFIAKIENGERRLDVVEFVHIAHLLSVDHGLILGKILFKKLPNKLIRSELIK
ncbi:conserved hypothetical protein [Photorhabdus asymbiotica]|uniref:HTH cro/C1-type domain-containing protein n=2 Tax=Photorhabdus asymbiotica TaxID=291112 RepID=B6VLW4_PHOAA|nr:conserved hypothetical protein [Photorhabdus asymbiotica]CAR67144.1 Conserved Hypothetical Protein [Photorhabdus asymbiotica subsp. asymbiotica ATCC 43949]